jgi:uncharacterized protein with PhoU and TrkA domain
MASPELFNKIIDMLVELKDTSELMLDLAYSSILLNSKELAEEVQALEEHVDKLHTDFELLVLSAQIAEVVLRGIKPHPVLALAIEEAEETVVHVQVSKESSLVGKTLREAQVHEETGMWVLVVRRGGKWVRPSSDLKINAGDVLIASGYAEGEEDLKKLASPENYSST